MKECMAECKWSYDRVMEDACGHMHGLLIVCKCKGHLATAQMCKFMCRLHGGQSAHIHIRLHFTKNLHTLFT